MFGGSLHFFRHHREAATRFACGRGLDRGIEREHVRLFGNIGDELDDFADLERRFAKPLDPLRRVLDLGADFVHPRNLVLHGLPAFFRRGEGLLRHAGGLHRTLRDFVDRLRHLQHR